MLMKSHPLHLVRYAGALSFLLTVSSLPAVDWPHWLGPNANNVAPAGAGFNPDLSQWTTAWSADVGLGYSSVIVAGGLAWTMGHDGRGKETVTCFEAGSGDVKWAFSYPAELIDRMHGGGPNASPTVAGDKVLTLSKDGQVHCLTREGGEKIWSANLVEMMGIEMPRWGFAGSPVVHEGRVLLSSSKVAALDLNSGRPIWVSKEAHYEGYTTPVVFEREGREFVAALDGKGLCILNFADGREIDRHPFKAQFDMVATTPIVLAGGERLFISGNTSSEMLSFNGLELTAVWSSREIRNAMNNSVLLDGVLYGIDGKHKNSRSRLVAVDAADGRVRWVKEDFGYGNTIGVGKTLLALTEDGELVTAAARPAGYVELGRQRVLSDTCWTTPVFADGRIYVRNDQGRVVCLSAP